MKVYKFKCDSCGSKNYIKTEDGYKCEYCGSIQDVIMPQEPEIKEPEVNEDNGFAQYQAAPVNSRTKFLIIKLIICLFAGYLGVHKFMEGRIVSGILYVFTGGLFGIGVFIDVIKYIIELAHSGRTYGN